MVTPLLFAAIVIVASTASAAFPSDTGAPVVVAGAVELVVVVAAVAVPASALAPDAVTLAVDGDWVVPVVAPVTPALAPRPAVRPAGAFASGRESLADDPAPESEEAPPAVVF
jgi:hypothetical protein